MKAALCFVLLAVALAAGVEEKKNEKRGLVGLGYGLGHGGYYGHGLGLYSHGGLDLGHGYYGGHGLYDHGIVASAPIVSHSYSAPIHYSAPLVSHGFGLGHGIGLGHGLAVGHGYGWH